MKRLIAAMTLAALSAAGPALAEPPPHAPRHHFFSDLGLTDEQREQMREIRARGGDREEIRAVLTEEQREQLEEKWQASGKGQHRDPAKRAEHLKRELDLSDEQGQEIRDILESGGSREDVRAVLTDEQQAKLDAMRAHKRGER